MARMINTQHSYTTHTKASRQICMHDTTTRCMMSSVTVWLSILLVTTKTANSAHLQKNARRWFMLRCGTL